jgi:hypothetical protein
VPFDAENYSALILEIATGTPKRLRQLRPEVPEGLERIVTKAMARDPDDRYPNMESLGRALEPFARGSSRSVRPSESGEQPQRHSMSVTTPFVSDSPTIVTTRRSWIGAAVAGAVLVIAGAAAWAVQKRGDAGAAVPAQAAQPPVAGPLLGDEVTRAASTPTTALPVASAAAVANALGADAGVLAQPAAAMPPVSPTPGATVPGAAPGASEHRARGQAGRVPEEAPVRARGRTGGLRTDEF